MFKRKPQRRLSEENAFLIDLQLLVKKPANFASAAIAQQSQNASVALGSSGFSYSGNDPAQGTSTLISKHEPCKPSENICESIAHQRTEHPPDAVCTADSLLSGRRTSQIIAQPDVKPEFLEDPSRDEAFGAIDFWIRKPKLHTKHLMIATTPGSGVTSVLANSGLTELYDDHPMDDFLSIGLSDRVPAVFECIEAMDPTERKNVTKAKGTRRRIFITYDLFAEPAKTWKTKCQVVKLEKPTESFIRKVLQTQGLLGGLSDMRIKDILSECNGNLVAAIHAAKLNITSAADMPCDLLKAMHLMLSHKPVQCLGGSSDAAFLGHMLQVNTPQVSMPIKDLAKTMDRYSIFDVVECRKELDSDSTWTLLTSTVRSQPKASKNVQQTLWPKSTKRLQSNFIDKITIS